MRGPPDGRSPDAGRAAGASEFIAVDNSDGSKHTRPARRRSSRAPDPGEQARQRALLKRGLHIKLVEVWKP